MLQNVLLSPAANGDASKHALVVVEFLPIGRHWHHQRAAAMGAGGGVTRVRVIWSARLRVRATPVACQSAKTTARSYNDLPGVRGGGWTVDRLRLIRSRIR